MSKFVLGTILGVVAGVLDVIIMKLTPGITFDSTALVAAGVNRFLIGLFIGWTATSPVKINPILAGLLIGFLVSLPDALISKAYLPVLIIGVVFGLIIGFLVSRFGV